MKEAALVERGYVTHPFGPNSIREPIAAIGNYTASVEDYVTCQIMCYNPKQ